MHVCFQLHLTSNYAFIMCTLSACMSVTVSSFQDPCILHLHPTISHVCNNFCIWSFPMSLTVVISVNLCIQACMSVTLATDQSSNGCYNCIRQAGPYQPAVKMQRNICSMQIPYSGVVLSVDTLHPISIFFCKFYSSIQLTFFHILIQKRFVLWSNTLSQSFQWYPIICHFIFWRNSIQK